MDFAYSVNGEVYQFSIPGGEKITLSELVEVLGVTQNTYSGEKAAFDSVDDFLKEVENVEFSDESLVKVTQIEGDWELESLKAFDTEESLTITMKNGDVVTVRVTDAQGSGSIQVSKSLEFEGMTQQEGLNKINGKLDNKIQFALRKPDGTWVSSPNDSSKQYVIELNIQNDWTGIKTNAFTGLEDGEYEVWEVHGDVNNGSIAPSYDGMRVSNELQIKTIRVINNSNRQQSESSGLYNNNATIKNGSVESMTFRNIFEPTSNTTSFEANKV